MASFDRFADKILKIEGGYQAQTADSGNYDSIGVLIGTKYGISAKTLEAWYKRPLVPADMQNLSKSTALNIYKAWYWDKLRCTEIISQPIANIFCDMGVHSGPGAAASLMRETLNELGANVGEGSSATTAVIAAINNANEARLHNAFKEKRERRYLNSGSSYTKGWLNRLDHFPDLVDTSLFGAKAGAWALWVLAIGSLLFVAYMVFVRGWMPWNKAATYAANTV